MQDRPTCSELLHAIEQFLEVDVVPALDGPKKFHARVAANVLAIVQRELRDEEVQLHAEWRRLDDVLGAAEPMPVEHAALRTGLAQRTALLCERIRDGDADAGSWRAAVLVHVRQTVMEKLAVANPKFIGVKES